MDTTAFVSNHDTPATPGQNCHGGEGPFACRNLIGALPDKQYIKFIHDDVIPPGSTFGDHCHHSAKPFEEWYLCLSGHGIMTLDGREYAMGPGDLSVCRANGTHGIRNTGDGDLRILVICASPVPEA